MNRETMNPVVDACRTARVIATCGTGGVGKTSIAAAMGLLAARSGRRAVVLTIDPARRLANAIGVSDSIGNEPVPVDVDAPGEFWIAMLDVRATFDNLVTSTAASPERAQQIIDNPFYKSLSQSLSGTRDYMAAERLYELVDDDRFDLVIVDTPPSRNALDFLESPERLARFLRHPIVRLLIAPGRGGLRI
ncbi:MAG: ArsA family ATPase, partial [Ilumatobacteraceae bacterium]